MVASSPWIVLLAQPVRCSSSCSEEGTVRLPEAVQQANGLFNGVNASSAAFHNGLPQARSAPGERKDRFQNAAADGKRLVRDKVAVFALSARVDIAGLHAARDGGAVRQDAAQHAIDLAEHGHAVYRTGYVARADRCSRS